MADLHNLPTEETQLSFDVRPHPRDVERARSLGREPWIQGTLAVSGSLNVGVDLHAGDELTISIAGPDGTVLAQGVAECKLPRFKEIKIKGEPVGTERAHTAKIVS